MKVSSFAVLNDGTDYVVNLPPSLYETAAQKALDSRMRSIKTKKQLDDLLNAFSRGNWGVRENGHKLPSPLLAAVMRVSGQDQASAEAALSKLTRAEKMQLRSTTAISAAIAEVLRERGDANDPQGLLSKVGAR